MEPPANKPMTASIIVRQTRDPYADDIQYFAQSQTTLEPNGLFNLDKAGLGKPGDIFLIVGIGEPRYSVFFPYQGTNSFVQRDVRRNLSYEGDRYPVLGVVDVKDEPQAYRCFRKRMNAKELAEQIAYCKGLVNHAVSWLTSIFYPSTLLDYETVPGISSSPEDTISGPHDDPGLLNVTAMTKGGHSPGLTHRLRPAKGEDPDGPDLEL